MRILKYRLPAMGAPGLDLDPPNIIDLPMAARPIAVGIQGETMMLWVEVDEGTEETTTERRFWVIGTGWPIELTGRKMKHIGTVLELESSFVWHVYEELGIGS